MTEQVFLSDLLLDAFSIKNKIFINYDSSGTVGKATGVAVSISAISVEGVDDTTLMSTLRKIDKIRFRISGTLFSFTITDRAYYRSAAGYGFFYYKIDSTIFDTTTAPTSSVVQLTIDFTPFLEDVLKLLQDYDILISNIDTSRQSVRAVKLDKEQDALFATNRTLVLNGEGTYANIQDSLYKDTGWKRGRYVGSSTSAATYNKVDPGISGKLFEGELYRNVASNNLILSGTYSDRNFKEYLHTQRNKELPAFKKVNLGISLSTLEVKDKAALTYTGAISSSLAGLESNDILYIQSASFDIYETLKVISAPTSGSLVVLRGYEESTRKDLSGCSGSIYRAEKYDIYDLGEFNRDTKRIVSSKLYLKDTAEIIYLDDYGTVYSSSFS